MKVLFTFWLLCITLFCAPHASAQNRQFKDSTEKLMAFYTDIVFLKKSSVTVSQFHYVAQKLCESNGLLNVDSLWNYAASKQKDTAWQETRTKLEYQVLLCEHYPCAKLDSLFLRRIGTASLEEAKIYASLLAQRQCAQSTSYLKAQQIISEKEPTFNSLFNQAKLLQKERRLSEASTAYAKAEKMARIPPQKSACYLGIAQCLEKQKINNKAKEFALLASEADPQNQESFLFLAQLYQKAEATCAFANEGEKLGVQLLIAQNLQKAGKKEEAAVYTNKVNSIKTKTALPDKVKVGCFVNEEVELKK
jgi:tetratricopeptide (TPR) repeat protein